MSNRFGTLVTHETYEENGQKYIKFSDGVIKRLIQKEGVYQILPLETE